MDAHAKDIVTKAIIEHVGILSQDKDTYYYIPKTCNKIGEDEAY